MKKPQYEYCLELNQRNRSRNGAKRNDGNFGESPEQSYKFVFVNFVKSEKRRGFTLKIFTFFGECVAMQAALLEPVLPGTEILRKIVRSKSL